MKKEKKINYKTINIQEFIKIAEREIKEWQKFLAECKKKLKKDK